MSALSAVPPAVPSAVSAPVQASPLPDWLHGLQAWVACESPSADTAAVTRMLERVEADGRALGLRSQRRELHGTPVPALLLSNRAEHDQRPGILLIGHLDTVHPLGSLAHNPWRIDADRLYGPGIYDMKAGVYLALQALGGLARAGASRLPVELLLVPDEEIGSPVSRPLIEELARQARYGLVCEPARAGSGDCVTARKGTGFVRLRTLGRAAHAGVRHELGRSAIREMAHQVLALEALTDYSQGVTLSVGTIQGGTTRNVVPDCCEILADFRIPDRVRGAALLARLQSLQPHDPDLRLEIEAAIHRPPMEPSAASAALLQQAQDYARQAGWTLGAAPMTGGGSDANFVAAVGLPVLDGLGPDGDGAHTRHEHILLSTLDQRLRFWQLMLQDLA
jgi:glutamate carboxypeptidase